MGVIRQSDNSTGQLPDRSAFEVAGIPFADDQRLDSLEQYAGQMPMSETEVMFFWLLSNQTNSFNHDKLLIWLNGGPGCTSMDGLFMENGPYSFESSSHLGFRDYSFTQQFDVLYIDQPFGTGFSMTSDDGYVTSFKDAATHLVEFMSRFYRVFPEYEGRQLYVSGESEAGTYIPYLADAIYKLPEEEQQRFNLGGLMIGNGWVDPYPMYMSYLDLLRDRKLVSDAVQKKMLVAMDRCTHEFNRAPQPVHTDICENILGPFMEEGGPSSGLCYNVYDLRLTDTQPACGMNWPPEVGMFTDYFRRKDVQRAVNVPEDMAPIKWKECQAKPNNMLRKDTSPPSVTLLGDILDRIPVLFFVGKEDFLCNYIGTEWTIGNMTWAGSTGFPESKQAAEWTIDGRVVGHIRSDRGLTYALIDDASHMVGVDKPREVLDLFTAFTNSSTANLRFRSSFRSGDPADLPTGPERVSHESLVKWVGVGVALFLVAMFLGCFLRRKQLFSWWMARRHYGGIQRSDDDGLVAGHRGHRGSDSDLDDAFMMSDFSFAKRKSVDSLDIGGLLLDDGTASSPDSEVDSNGTAKSARQPASKPI
ncbi:Cell death protease [Coemansia sp. RSA 552]|nr:Cell death protease [Coemansia sp. RSA 552]